MRDLRLDPSGGDCDTDTETEEKITAFIQVTCWFRLNEEKKSGTKYKYKSC